MNFKIIEAVLSILEKQTKRNYYNEGINKSKDSKTLRGILSEMRKNNFLKRGTLQIQYITKNIYKCMMQ